MSEPTAPAPLRQAATIIVLRPGEPGSGAEVLLLQRSRKVGFFPRAWVFPGGRLDPEDHTLTSEGAVPGLATSDRAFAVAAIRECFEESGIWLGHGRPDAGLRDRLLDTRAGIVPADQVVPDLDRLRSWAWWVTPEAERRRYDTRFFITCLTRAQSAHATHDTRETVDSRWLRPEAALDAAARGDLFVAPPTWRTLQELAEFESVDDIWTHARSRPIPRVMPVLERADSGVAIHLPGHSIHPDPVHPIHASFARSIVSSSSMVVGMAAVAAPRSSTQHARPPCRPHRGRYLSQQSPAAPALHTPQVNRWSRLVSCPCSWSSGARASQPAELLCPTTHYR